MHRVAVRLLTLGVIVFCSACSRDAGSKNLEQADKILILKSAHLLNLMSGDRVLRTYKVALGRNPVGPKTRRGDHRTPEGEYLIDSKKANSRFYRALHVSYPNQTDREQARRNGYDPGGDVEIHGIENGLGWIGKLHKTIDWTYGCIAVTDPEIEEIWQRGFSRNSR
jgi:murein L,D-transpeptidase YafK